MKESNGKHPRVLVVAPLYHTERGGLGRQAVLLTERLAELGAHPLVATRKMRGLPWRPFSRLVRILPIRAGRPETHNYEAPNLTNLLTSLRFSLGLLGVMGARAGSYDVVHVHGASLPLLVVLPWAKLLGKKVVGKVAALHQGVEAGDLRAHYGPLGKALAWLAGRSDALVATTTEIGEALHGEGYGWERIVRIPNFVDTGRFAPPEEAARAAARAELGWTGRTVVLHSGRLAARKACDVLLRAWARALPSCEEAAPLLVFLGDGPERGPLEALTRALGLEPSVAFVGFRTDVERCLGAADLLVIASRVEGLPNALLEGMACGLPVLATRLGGALEVVLEEQTGLLVPADDEQALADGLVRLVPDEALRARMGRAGAERIRSTFTLEAIAPHYLELYRRLLAGEDPHGASVFPREAE